VNRHARIHLAQHSRLLNKIERNSFTVCASGLSLSVNGNQAQLSSDRVLPVSINKHAARSSKTSTQFVPLDDC
jgi:hypothetical protein